MFIYASFASCEGSRFSRRYLTGLFPWTMWLGQVQMFLRISYYPWQYPFFVHFGGQLLFVCPHSYSSDFQSCPHFSFVLKDLYKHVFKFPNNDCLQLEGVWATTGVSGLVVSDLGISLLRTSAKTHNFKATRRARTVSHARNRKSGWGVRRGAY